MARVPFTTIFRRNEDGTIEPVQQVRIGGILLSPGLMLRLGQIIGGVDLTQYSSNDFDIDVKDGILTINGIYGQNQ
jgi:hypothetical protein